MGVDVEDAVDALLAAAGEGLPPSTGARQWAMAQGSVFVNPFLDPANPKDTIRYREGGREREMTLPMTFADFAMTEARFRKHFRMAPPDTWHEDMVPLAEFLDMDEDEREGKYPFIWSVDKRSHLTRLMVDAIMVQSCEERRDFWIMLKAIAGDCDNQGRRVAGLANRPVGVENAEKGNYRVVNSRDAYIVLEKGGIAGGTAVGTWISLADQS